MDIYNNINKTPEDYTSTNTLARFIDAFGFRNRFATEGLTDNEINFRPIEGSMDMYELLVHIYDIAYWTYYKITKNKIESKPSEYEDLRLQTLELIKATSDFLHQADDFVLKEIDATPGSSLAKHPLWYFMNGPIADGLTHIGQITSWRRIASNPQPKNMNLFLGTSKV